jgi:hypothetical protein
MATTPKSQSGSSKHPKGGVSSMFLDSLGGGSFSDIGGSEDEGGTRVKKNAKKGATSKAGKNTDKKTKKESDTPKKKNRMGQKARQL